MTLLSSKSYFCKKYFVQYKQPYCAITNLQKSFSNFNNDLTMDYDTMKSIKINP